jgi:hypothetical protein
MPQTYYEYSGSALSATTYSVPFKYLVIDDVNALGFNGTSWTALALHAVTPRDAINKTITLASAPIGSYSKLRLYRSTTTTQLIDFQNGSRLTENDLDTAYQQSLFVAQEIAEDSSTSQFAAVRKAGAEAGTSLSNFASEKLVSDATNGLIDGSNTLFNITAFTPQTTETEAYRVTINGLLQAPDSYAISLATPNLVFTTAPASGAEVVVVTTASSANAAFVDTSTLEITSSNSINVKDLGITNAKIAGGITQDKLVGGITNAQLAGGITQDKLAGGITNAQLAGSIATSKLAGVIDDDTFTTGVSATTLASSESIKAYVDNITAKVFRSGFVSLGTEATASSPILFTHGLGVIPDIVTFQLKYVRVNTDGISPITADGFTTGDIISLGGANLESNHHGMVLKLTTSQVKLKIGASGLYLLGFDDGYNLDINQSYWNIQCIASIFQP